MSQFVFLLIFAGLAWLFLLPWVLMWLWNITLPELASVGELRYWSAFRLLLIASILFGGIPFSYNVNKNVNEQINVPPTLSSSIHS